MKRIVNALGKPNWGKQGYAVFVLSATTAIALPAQTFTTLFSFDGKDGQQPASALIQATNGDFYGTTYYGGADEIDGTIFKITPSGKLTRLHSFCSSGVFPDCLDGQQPESPLIQATNGDFYGITRAGGTTGFGTVFKITPSGTLTTLHSFCSSGVFPDCPDGQQPGSALVQASNGDLYGTTISGGAYDGGTIFKITLGGTLTTLYSFYGGYPEAALIQATNGDFYGTTSYAGAKGLGTVFKITPSGKLTTLHRFDGTDGENPAAALIQATNGDLYGTTPGGGTGANCLAPNGCGTIFKITPSGTLTTVYSFCSQSGCTDGQGPRAGLIEATDGDFYGTTFEGGTNCAPYGCGTIFKITPSGKLTTLYSFCSAGVFPDCPDGDGPDAGLIQATNGDFYGTAGGGANVDYGMVFSLSAGLAPFVETRTASGRVGAVVEILGTDLTGASSVSFNGTAAGVFKVFSSSAIAARVPAGATTGTVQVVTPSGTLSSNIPFRVVE